MKLVDEFRGFMMSRHLRYSEASDYMACPWRWDMKYNQGWSKVGVQEKRDLGTAFHLGIAATLRFQNLKEGLLAINRWAADLKTEVYEFPATDEDFDFNAEMAMIDDITVQAKDLLRAAVKWLKLKEWETLTLDDHVTSVTNLAIEAEIFARGELIPAGWPGVVGHVDWVAHHIPTDTNWVIDHKTLKTLHTDKQEEYRLQFPMYQVILEDCYGIKVNGSATFQVRSTPPRKPAINQNGSVSRARIATTWDVYRQTVIDQGGDPADYEVEMKPKLDVPFHKLSFTYRGGPELKGIWLDVVIPMAEEMARIVKEHDTPCRHFGSLYCGSCEFKEVCIESLRGRDITYLLKTGFRKVGNPEAVPIQDVVEFADDAD